MLERRFPRETASLEGLVGFVREFLDGEGLPEAHAFDLDLMLEELFTNVVKYGRGRGDVHVALRRDADRVTLVIRAADTERFDPTQAPDPDLDVPLHERRAGGLGLFLVRRLADEFHYDYTDRTSTVTVRKRLEG